MSKRNARQPATWLRPLLFSAIGGALCLCAALAFFAFIMVKGSLSAGLSGAFATISACFGCCASAWIAAKACKSGGLRCGLISFAVYALILSGAAAALGTSPLESAGLLRTILLLPAGCAGGLLGLRSAEKQARRRRV
ncbi:MAG: TIGR04086 family membrane protein [Faecalibacterium sp.]|jgi:putative membrane protein (TIGR04086 family)|nr:TIGR04086 family membrane protein [Faecalibacterium sp.]